MNIFKRALRALTFENGLTAIDHGDGTFTLRDVPIFGEVAADSNGNKIAATPEWLRSAFDRAQLSQSEGFAGPVHEGHHAKWDVLGQAKDERPRLGGLVLTDLRPHKVEGKVEQTIFADIVDIPADKFARIQKGELPYVSVEYIEEHRPAIDSLAVTGSSCPFKRYANLKVGRVVKAPRASAFTVVNPPAPSAVRGITYLTGGNVAEEPKKPATQVKDEKKGGEAGDNQTPAPPAPGNTGNQEAQAKPGPNGSSEPTKPAQAQQDASVGTAPPWASAMTQAFAGLVATVQAMAQKMGATISPLMPSGPATIPNGFNPAIQHTVQETQAPAMDARTFGELHGHVQNLLRKDEAREREDATRLSVAIFEARCKGWQFDDSDRVALRTCVEAGGEKAAQAFIDQLKKRPKEMIQKASDFTARSEPIQDSPAVMTFVSKGPVALEKARRFSAMHAQLVAAGLSPSPEDKFIEHQFASEGDLARANAIIKGEK